MTGESLTNLTLSQPAFVGYPISKSDYRIHGEWPAANQVVTDAW